MKKALNFVIIYLITLISGTFLGTLLYSFYINVLNFIAGTEITFFVKEDMFYALFYIAFCVLILICPLISYYKIRHPGGIPQLITYIVLALLTWVIFIPGLFKITDNYYEKHYEVSEQRPLSKNYFRQIDDKVYYFTKDFVEKKDGSLETTAVIIDTDAEYKKVSVEKYLDSSESELHTIADPYNEILLKNTLQNNDFPVSIKFKYIISNIKDNLNNGLIPFIGYLSLGLVLASVFALTNFFGWKLLNTLLLVILSAVILTINSCPALFYIDVLEEKLAGTGFLKLFSYFGTEPLLVFINFVLSFIFILIGVIHFIVLKHRSKNR